MSDGYTIWLSTLNNNLPTYFSYFAPWIGISSGAFALAALFLRKKTQEDSLIRFLFKWQYSIVLIYALNMIFLDTQFTRLFNYNSFINVTDSFCKIQFVFLRFTYCSAPWMQVVFNTVFSFITLIL